jgi:2-oxoglutarate dehydrogenase E2 component (dihydrolipoamide succinyltransferase)
LSQGTIVEWTAPIGQAVKTDDVIALIETDKVTIDIKANMDGVITQHFGSV